MRAQFNQSPKRRALKLDEWPLVDRAAWQRARARGDVLEPESGGLAAHWKNSSEKTFAKAYGQFLGFLDRHGLLDEASSPATRLNPEVLGQYIKQRQALNASGTALSQMRLLNCAVKAMFPQEDWSWMKQTIQNLSYTAKLSRHKRANIVPIQELLQLGFDLMAEAEGADGGTIFDRALLYRDGLIIAMLAARPFRASNFVSIVIGEHLIKRGPTFWLCFASCETKNNQPIKLPLPEILNPHIQRYCSCYRPVLFPKNRGWTKGSQDTGTICSALWVSSRGNPMPASTVYERVTTLTRVRFGHAINPHLFRNCAATSIALDDPGHVRIAAKLLGHSRFNTTEHYYIQAQSFEASCRYQLEIEAPRPQNEANQIYRCGNAKAEIAS